MRFDVETGQTLIHLHIENDDRKHIQAICDNKTYTLDYVKMKDDHLLLRLNGHNYDILINKEENNREMNVNGKPVELTIYDARMRKLKALSKSDRNPKSSKEIKAPMPGLVLHVHIKEGDEVKANDGLLVIEAMKMENEIRAVSNGVIKKINVKEGQAVDKGSLLLQLE